MPYTQLTARWNGFTGAPGFTRMKFLGALNVADANTAGANFRTFMNALAVYGPAGGNISFDSTAQIYDDLGVQTGELTLSAVPAQIALTGPSAYAGGAGAVVNWLTGAFHQGRKVRGRTFLVPLTQAAYQADGTLSSTFQTALQAAGSTFATSSPTPIIFSDKTSKLGVRSTLLAVVTGATIPDRTAILRSRRD